MSCPQRRRPFRSGGPSLESAQRERTVREGVSRHAPCGDTAREENERPPCETGKHVDGSGCPVKPSPKQRSKEKKRRMVFRSLFQVFSCVFLFLKTPLWLFSGPCDVACCTYQLTPVRPDTEKALREGTHHRNHRLLVCRTLQHHEAAKQGGSCGLGSEMV